MYIYLDDFNIETLDNNTLNQHIYNKINLMTVLWERLNFFKE